MRVIAGRPTLLLLLTVEVVRGFGKLRRPALIYFYGIRRKRLGILPCFLLWPHVYEMVMMGAVASAGR